MIVVYVFFGIGFVFGVLHGRGKLEDQVCDSCHKKLFEENT